MLDLSSNEIADISERLDVAHQAEPPGQLCRQELQGPGHTGEFCQEILPQSTVPGGWRDGRGLGEEFWFLKEQILLVE